MSAFYREPAREIPVVAEVDVLVAGGGPAGIGAALAAARNGAKTMIVEQSNCLGGVATSGMMSHWCGGTESPLLEEISKRMAACASLPKSDKPDESWTIAHESLKKTLLDLLAEAGVEIQLYTFISRAIVEGSTVKGIVTESKSGREAILAKTVIDATGDGDVAASAGAEFYKGREGDGKTQPVTLMFRIGGVDCAKAIFPGSFETQVEVPKGEIQALARKHLPFPAGHVLLYRTRFPGEVCVNMTNVIDIDGTNVRDLSKAEGVCREQMELIVKFLREFAPGYENCFAVASASCIGVRETRHFKGLKSVTEQDIVEARVFEDWIATRNKFNFDIHSVSGPGLDANGAQKRFQAKGKYSIPFGACVPERIDGVLLAGRNISGTHKAHSNYRVMPICLNIGQGVGTAAAIAAKDGVPARKVEIAKVQAALNAAGVKP